MQNLPPQLTPQSQSPMQNMPSNLSDMGGQMMEGMGNQEQQPEKIVAHFSPDEISDLNKAQGGEVFDPETGLRDYTPLDSLIKIPEIREAIIADFSQKKQKFAIGGEVEEQGRPIDPELEKLRMEGRHGDTELAIITPYFLDFFSELSGHPPHENPHTGLPEFGGAGSFIKSTVRAVGALFGPITGFAASKLTGQSTSAALKNAGVGAALATLPFIGSALGGSGGFGSFLGGSSGAAGSGGFLGNIGSGLGNFFGMGGGSSPAVVGADTVGRMLPASAFGQNMIQAAGQTGSGGFLGNILGSFGGGAGGSGGLLSSLGSGIGKALPLIGSSLLMAKGHKDEQKGIREHQQALEAKEQREKAENEAMRERMGFNAKLNPIEPYRRRQINPNITPEQYSRGVAPSYFENYAEGGAIRGDGKGQQDNIPMDIKDGSYIFDASTVSDIGDGSSNAGIKELDRYFSRIPSQQDESGAQGYESKGGYIQAMVSNDEYRLSPEKVTAIGGGSNKKGAQILKKFVEEIREKKRTSGKRLPPKSKPIGGYLKSINRNAA